MIGDVGIYFVVSYFFQNRERVRPSRFDETIEFCVICVRKLGKVVGKFAANNCGRSKDQSSSSELVCYEGTLTFWEFITLAAERLNQHCANNPRTSVGYMSRS